MLDLTCDVCGIGQAIGVACTSQPYSCAYCKACAEQGADPEFIFQYLLDDVAGGDSTKIVEGLVCYSRRLMRYVEFHEWARLVK